MDFVQALLSLAIGAVGGVGSALLTRLVKPHAENWLEEQREQRAVRRVANESADQRRRAELERLADWIRKPNDPLFGKIAASAVGDDTLTEYVGRINVASTHEERRDAQGDAATRLGELMR